MINQSVMMQYGRQKQIESTVNDRTGKDAK